MGPAIDSKKSIPPAYKALAGRHDNPIPNRFLAPIDGLKIPAQESIPLAYAVWQVGTRYDNPIRTRFLAPIDCYKIPARSITASSNTVES